MQPDRPTSTPTTTRAVVIHQYTDGYDHLNVEDRPVTPPAAGEVLVRVTASPINPSDLAYVQGYYGVRKPLPSVPGFEAGGTIIAVGEGVDPGRIGQVVACFAGDTDGSWTEITRTQSRYCFPVGDQVDAEAAATLLVNPLTACALLDRAEGAPAIAQTAAASALGQMIALLAMRRGIPMLHIVRRDEQIETLRALGAEYVLNSESTSFDHDFRDLSRKLGVKVCFDAVAGDTGTHLLRLMPSQSRLIVYGGLGGDSVQVTVGDLLFKDKKVEGYWLSHWMRDGAAVAKAWTEVRANLDLFRSQVRARYPLDRIHDAIADYSARMSGGKVLITP